MRLIQHHFLLRSMGLARNAICSPPNRPIAPLPQLVTKMNTADPRRIHPGTSEG